MKASVVTAKQQLTENQTANGVWAWLKTCLICGEVHQFRNRLSHEHMHHPSSTCRCSGTWADPDDGHYYRPRMNDNRVDELRSEYEQDRAAGGEPNRP